jgi:hypothetical protein
MERIPLAADPLNFVAAHLAARRGGASVSVSESRVFLRNAMPTSQLSDQELFELIVMAAVRMGFAVEFDEASVCDGGDGGWPGSATCLSPATRPAPDPTLSGPGVPG